MGHGVSMPVRVKNRKYVQCPYMFRTIECISMHFAVGFRSSTECLVACSISLVMKILGRTWIDTRLYNATFELKVFHRQELSSRNTKAIGGIFCLI